jgi:hypothetical protein
MKAVERRLGTDCDVQGRLVKTEDLITEDGRAWREASPAELNVLAPDALVWFGRGESHQAGEYADYRFPGNYPFLSGLACLHPVYVLAEPHSERWKLRMRLAV